MQNVQIENSTQSLTMQTLQIVTGPAEPQRDSNAVQLNTSRCNHNEIVPTYIH